MGRDARLNPRSHDGKASERDVLNARLRRFVESFQTRADFDAYLDGGHHGVSLVSDEHRVYLESLLPEWLRHAEVRSSESDGFQYAAGRQWGRGDPQ